MAMNGPDPSMIGLEFGELPDKIAKAYDREHEAYFDRGYQWMIVKVGEINFDRWRYRAGEGWVKD